MNHKQTFSKTVIEYWQAQSGTNIFFENEDFILFFNEELDEDYKLMTLEFSDKKSWIIIRSEVLELIKKEDFKRFNFSESILLLKEKGINLHGSDNVFYFFENEKTRLNKLIIPQNIRQLSTSDLFYFTEFESTATVRDLDDASVSLDDWKVYGAFEDGKLVAVCSMYLWDDNCTIADIGVLTLPSYRGKGLAKMLVQSISKSALLDGFEPQYRCQLDNIVSVALAKKLCMDLFGFWNVSTQNKY